MEITVGSLFSGIGGLDLGLERAGMKVIWQSEIDKYCCKILKKHWPEVPNHGNIKEINWQEIQRPNIIAGGYPCQPFSQAGKRKGTQDPRHLWPWVREAISQLQPDYAILENVPGHLTMGGTEVIGALTEIGYNAEWRVVSAAGLGANHLRKRIIIVAYPNSQRPHRTEIDTTNREQSAQPQFASCCQTLAYTDSSDATDGGKCAHVASQNNCRGNDRSRSNSDVGQISVGGSRQNTCYVAHADNAGSGTSKCCVEQKHASGVIFGHDSQHGLSGCCTNVANSNRERLKECEPKTQSISWASGRSQPNYANHWQIEPNVGRVADGIPNRVDRLRGLGNAVVPQVAEYIGRLVMEQYK
jgi:DNA (cytosine-5)-methyltransferase 1